MKKEGIEKLTNLCSRRGILLPSYEIYGELSGFYDYGPIGTLIRRKIEGLWRKMFIDDMGNMEVETSIIGPSILFEASGHLRTFTDPITKCEKCGATYRVDKMLQAYFVEKKDFGKAAAVLKMGLDEMDKALQESGIKCEKCGGKLGKVTYFNLMMGTEIGPLGNTKGYLRPETAQGIFTDMKKLARVYGIKLPIGIGQVGKAFRNEISPRKILIRMREFTQMELEYFFDPEESALSINGSGVNEADLTKEVNFLTRETQEKGGQEPEKMKINELISKGLIPNALFGYLLQYEARFIESLGIKEADVRYREPMKEELPHYSKGNVDVEVLVGGDFEEVIGNAYRTDFDLQNHQKFSKEDMSIMNGTKKVVPHVVEASFGLDRLFWAALSNSLYMDDKRGWEVMQLNPSISPYDYALFPLQKDDKIMAKSSEINSKLKALGLSVFFGQTGSIGKRYARADEIGIPKAVTVDYQTLEDDTVTVRNINDASQIRIGVGELK
ncbi:MAG: glycine--tRNA ligase [Candidatus Micrarchaeaceae archaeon]